MYLQTNFYEIKKQEYNEVTRNCIEVAVSKLNEIGDHPLMMLGKIQSGKTKSFIGVISLSFDKGYDLAIVLTKNSNALAKQTVARMNSEFSYFKNEDIVEIHDIMCMPPNMSRFELNKKMIIVVKKEKNNLPKMMQFIKNYTFNENKKCLIIDDEADFCSIGYDKSKETQEFDLRKIASQINELRLQLTCKFIQVTATPYSLYLQPEEIELQGKQEIKPIKPTDTVLVPYGEGYIGGDYYFNHIEYPLGEHLFYPIAENELLIIKNNDRRRFKEEEALTSPKIEGLRNGIIQFIIGGCIRIIQNGGMPRGKNNKFSFIIHTETSKGAHNRQESIINTLLEALEEQVRLDTPLVNEYIEKGYKHLEESILQYGFIMPSYEEVSNIVKRAIKDQWITKAIVNSENDIDALLDDEGQLRLRTPLNIFIGGQILDRGITIRNLIGFYYGRAPQKMQQDTVLQHSRMYGYRSKEDLSVTRFYTTHDLHARMRQINDFDSKLREDFEAGNFEKGIIFISKASDGKIIPCSPTKIRISNTQVLREGKTVTPIGFNTLCKSNIEKKVKQIDDILMNHNNGELKGMFDIPLKEACQIVGLIYEILQIESDTCITNATFISLLKYITSEKVHIYCGIDRNISRLRKTSRYYSDMPYNIDNDLKQAKELAVNEPTLMLMKQNGSKEKGWRDSPFYWPVLVIQKNIDTSVYVSDLLR